MKIVYFSHDLRAYPELREVLLSFSAEESWIWNLRYCAWSERDEFWMMYHHLSVILDGCEVDEMPCRKGVWKFDTLWEHPLGKGEVTCHSSWLYSFMHRRYVEGYYKSSSLTHDANGREHSTCCGRNLCIWPRGWSQYSISLWTYHSLTSWDVIDQCWPECSVLSSSTSYSGFYLNLVQLIAWAEDTYIGLILRFAIVSSTLRSLFSPSDENTARNSWRRV